MAICGFCKEKVIVKGAYHKTQYPKTPITVLVEKDTEHLRMFSCPHCKSVLGFVLR